MKTTSTDDKRKIERIAHPLKMRMLKVKNKVQLSPTMVKITLTGDDLDGFVSSSPDDHVKVFFPYTGDTMPVVMVMTETGPQMPEGDKKPIMRDYTPMRYDSSLKELDLHFVLHREGAATNWARNAEIGDVLGVGGPRGSLVVPYTFDWYFMIGDESALPSFSRRLKELPANAKAIVIMSATNKESYQELEHNTHTKINWTYENNLLEMIKKIELPDGDPFIWVSCEKSQMQDIKKYLLETKHFNPDWIKATAYWTKS